MFFVLSSSRKLRVSGAVCQELGSKAYIYIFSPYYFTVTNGSCQQQGHCMYTLNKSLIFLCVLVYLTSVQEYISEQSWSSGDPTSAKAFSIQRILLGLEFEAILAVYFCMCNMAITRLSFFPVQCKVYGPQIGSE